MAPHSHEPHDPTIANLSLNDPRCNSDSCLAFEAARIASQASISYAWQFEYGHWVTWYYLIIIFLFMLLFRYQSWEGRRPRSTSSTRPSLANKTVAAWRAVFYRRYSGRVADVLGLPSLGMQFFLFAAIIFAIVATFAVRPYYRERRGYGSPPLAIRCGLMAIALVPIIVALSGKVNVVTMLTGIGYEKLNVVHRWVSWISFALSIAHTVPFVAAPLMEGGPSELYKQYYSPGAFEYTGTPPMAMLFFLSIFSIPYVRARTYELFVHSHILAAIVYLGLMFWHAGDLGDSWAYLWATVAIWLFSLFGRIFYKSSAFSIRRSWMEGFPSNVQSLPGNMLKLQVLVPSTYRWRPASSLGTQVGHEKLSVVHTLVFLVRPHKGFTHRLSTYTKSNTDITLQTMVDGPYGGLSTKPENLYDSIILVAGGGGITASISWLLHLADRMTAGNVTVTQVKLLWVVRKKVHLHWLHEELNRAQAMAPSGSVSYEFYITDDAGSAIDAERNDQYDGIVKKASSAVQELPESIGSDKTPELLQRPDILHMGRPLLDERILQVLEAPRTCVLGCGPESMKIDLSNAVAKAQGRVWAGELREVALHTETFGW